MARISYSDDFRREAVRLVVIDGHSRKQVARELDISLGSLRDWIHKLAPDGPVVSDKLPEAEQLRQLKREVERLRMERDILKKLGRQSGMEQQVLQPPQVSGRVPTEAAPLHP